MTRRIVLVVLAAGLAFNGAHMLFGAEHWYGSLDSVPFTGPFNPHFVKDIGCAYIASAAGIALGAWRIEWLVPSALAPVAFLGLHAFVHVADAWAGAESAHHAGLVDAIGVYAPPLIVLLAMPLRGMFRGMLRGRLRSTAESRRRINSRPVA